MPPSPTRAYYPGTTEPIPIPGTIGRGAAELLQLSRFHLERGDGDEVAVRVEAAFGLREAGPAAGAVILVGVDGARAGPAADARVALIVERIIRDPVLHDEGPDVAL